MSFAKRLVTITLFTAPIFLAGCVEEPAGPAPYDCCYSYYDYPYGEYPWWGDEGFVAGYERHPHGNWGHFHSAGPHGGFAHGGGGGGHGDGGHH